MTGNEALFEAALWWMWRHRCNDILNARNQWTDHKVVALARITASNVKLNMSRSSSFITFKNRLCWEPPVQNSFKVKCDASLFIDLNLTDFGCLIRDSNSGWISDCSGSSPPWSIVRCELFAVWRGLVLAWYCGLRDIVCKMDCLDILYFLHDSI